MGGVAKSVSNAVSNTVHSVVHTVSTAVTNPSKLTLKDVANVVAPGLAAPAANLSPKSVFQGQVGVGEGAAAVAGGEALVGAASGASYALSSSGGSGIASSLGLSGLSGTGGTATGLFPAIGGYLKTGASYLNAGSALSKVGSFFKGANADLTSAVHYGGSALIGSSAASGITLGGVGNSLLRGYRDVRGYFGGGSSGAPAGSPGSGFQSGSYLSSLRSGLSSVYANTRSALAGAAGGLDPASLALAQEAGALPPGSVGAGVSSGGGAFAGGGSSSMITYLVIGVIVAGGFYLWQKRKKK